jgi:hypothetical protein
LVWDDGRWGCNGDDDFAAAQAKAIAPVTPSNLNATGLLLIFGVTDKEPTNWSGEISLSTGDILALSGWRLSPKGSN